MSQIEYNPRVNDQSGAIMGQAVAASAQTRAAGDQALASGIASGATSLASGVGQAVGSYLATRSAKQRNEGEIDAAVQSGYLTPEYGDKLINMPLDKQSGSLARLRESVRLGDQMALQNVKHGQQLDYLGAQTEASKDIITYRNENPGPTRGQVIQTEQGVFTAFPDNPDLPPVPLTDPQGNQLTPRQPAGNPWMDILRQPPQSSPSSPAAPAQQNAMPTFASPSEAARSGLPSGTQFRDPQGTIRRIP